MTVRDQVLLKQDKIDKLSTTFNKTPHKVISKDSNNVVVKSPSGAMYSRNTTFVKKYYTAAQSINKTQTAQAEHQNKHTWVWGDHNKASQLKETNTKAAIQG